MPKQTQQTPALEIGKRVQWTDAKGITRVNRLIWIYENGTAAVNHFDTGLGKSAAIVPVHSLIPVSL